MQEFGSYVVVWRTIQCGPTTVTQMSVPLGTQTNFSVALAPDVVRQNSKSLLPQN